MKTAFNNGNEEVSKAPATCGHVCESIGLQNLRFLIHGLALIVFLLGGAACFSSLEYANEQAERGHYRRGMAAFLDRYPDVNRSDLNRILQMHAEAYSAGMSPGKALRWDFSGALNFVGTVVSTVGFGLTTPRTNAGKICLIFYGFIGCSGAILFFNLFLERIINFFVIILRAFNRYHQYQLAASQDQQRAWSNSVAMEDSNNEIGASQTVGGQQNMSMSSGALANEESIKLPATTAATPVTSATVNPESAWKPSIYVVQVFLFFTATVIAITASILYTRMEKWTFLESIYFCFVAFSTIGFGDYVTTESADYPTNITFYRILNFLFLSIGCCCIYSFFNVTSLVIRSILDCLIHFLCRYCHVCWQQTTVHRNKGPVGGCQKSTKSRRGAVFEDSIINPSDGELFGASGDDGGGGNSDPRHKHRRLSFSSFSDAESSDLIAIRGLLRNNQFALAILQKQLSDSGRRNSCNSDNVTLDTLGPLAIVGKKFEEEESDSL